MKSFFFLVLGLLIIFGSVFLVFQRLMTEESEVRTIRVNDTEIRVEVAETLESRQTGLSGREFLPEGTGMLFVFEDLARHGFWMKDMNFAIDIIWTDGEGRVVDIAKEVSPDTFPEVFYPKQLAKYVLELNAGDAEKFGIDTGVKLYLDR
ncbi:MAG: DUF192 domain-containing protein [bacterium]|nr:DUF192 domain-containing protein [bacterium]